MLTLITPFLWILKFEGGEAWHGKARCGTVRCGTERRCKATAIKLYFHFICTNLFVFFIFLGFYTGNFVQRDVKMFFVDGLLIVLFYFRCWETFRFRFL